MKEPRVNIGQSEFQDTFMVVADEPTPFRKLRKLELHIKELEDAIQHNEFAIRKARVKMKRLKSSIDELDRIEYEEIEYGMKGHQQLKNDAKRRLANFKEIKRQLLEDTPEEYWEQGFENAEGEYWIEYFSRRAALEIMGQGRIHTATLEQIMRFPDEIAARIMKLTPHKQKRMAFIANVADEEVKKINTEYDKQKQLEGR